MVPQQSFPLPWTEAGRQDPFPWFAHMRSQHPVAFHEELGAWGIFRYDDVLAVLKDNLNFSIAASYATLEPEHRRYHLLAETLPSLDQPEHTRHRALENPAFAPRAIELLRPVIERAARRLLKESVAKKTFDLIGEVAYPLPLSAIAILLGLPEDPAQFRRFVRGFKGARHELGSAHLVDFDRALATRIAFEEYIAEAVDERRACLGQDMISSLLTADLTGVSLDRHEMLVKTTMSLFGAGTHTTQTLIGNTVIELLRHPGALQQLRTRPELVESTIEEVLRYHSPAQAIKRTTTVEVELHRQRIPAGSPVVLWLQAANRDPDVFPEPDRFDIERTPNRHLAFAFGIHFCIGAPLARLEAQVALREILAATQTIEFADPETPLDWIDALEVVCVRRLPVRVTPA